MALVNTYEVQVNHIEMPAQKQFERINNCNDRTNVWANSAELEQSHLDLHCFLTHFAFFFSINFCRFFFLKSLLQKLG